MLPTDDDRLFDRLLITLLPDTDYDSAQLVWRGLLLMLVTFYTIGLLGGISENKGQLLHLVNLPFHEAGHGVFGLFGELTQSLGGTLLQLLSALVVLAAPPR